MSPTGSLQNESQLPPGSEIANRIISDTVEGNLLLRIKHGALPFAQESDIVQFASLDDAMSEVMQFQKLQTKSFARRSSAEGYNHNLTGKFNRFYGCTVPLFTHSKYVSSSINIELNFDPIRTFCSVF